jgi:hypothetical protein
MYPVVWNEIHRFMIENSVHISLFAKYLKPEYPVSLAYLPSFSDRNIQIRQVAHLLEIPVFSQ